ncbi:GntR family transcriptional regulator [Roseomonas genomospecies 6]|uniref:GntR family transcriptional regulator n=1 Tax=Roseomonas genomospecies 6 TaxID=214106 RepID=A0A9W7TYY7_9PROT|nr:GntR family transcriptional regulator [Roseomonas genomospecies 6]KAA0680646.1 GntR family transcriptional regulator [Roseomonas genomospecies 6]
MKNERLVLERNTLDSVIHKELRKRIISLSLQPGSMIYENAVADEFGVSRTPVRQAFSRLANEGLLSILPQRGAQVSRLSAAKVREAQFIREALEVSAFGEVARIWNRTADHSAAQTKALSLIEQQRQVVQEKDYVGFTELDVAFHDTVIGVLGNVMLLEMLRDVRMHLTRVRFLELKEAHHEDDAIADHVKLMKSIMANDVAGTQSLLLTHLKMIEAMRDDILKRHDALFEPAPPLGLPDKIA